MPLDPNIILAARPQFLDVGEAIGRGLTLKSLRNQGLAQDQQIADANTARQKLLKLQELGRGATSQEDLRQRLLNAGFAAEAFAMDKDIGEGQKRTADIDKTNAETYAKTFETQTKQFDRALQLLSGATDQATYEAGMMQATREGLNVSNLPPTFSPQAVKAMTMQLLDAKERLAASVAQQNAETSRGQLGVAQGNLRVAQGGLANSRARLSFEQAQGKAPSGYRADGNGNLTFIPGGPADPATTRRAAPTEFQGKSAGFAARAAESNKIITDLEGKYSTFGLSAKRAAESVPLIGGTLGYLGNLVNSDSTQMVEQAQRDFVNALLRQESGAAIRESEFANATQQYFPQPGDSAAVVKQKARNRDIAIQGLSNNAGLAAFTPTSPSATPTAPTGTTLSNW